MTVPRTSKMVTDRQKRYELVVELVGSQREDLIDALNLRLRGGGQSLPPADVSAYLAGLTGCLGRSFEELIRTERIHLDELSGDAARRRRRDEAVSELRRVLFGMRSLLRGAFGDLLTQKLGFEKRLDPHPLPLLRQGLRIEDGLRDPGVVPEPRFRGVTLDLESLADEIRPYLRELREAIDGVTEDFAKVQGTKVAKDRAMDAFDRTFGQVARTLVEAFRLAGKPELASRIPTGLRRRRKRSNVEEKRPEA